nr:variable surface lipoprotein [Mycoplasmopsis bovis]
MKKNKLLLSLGSLSIFSAIPFVALLNVIIQKLKIIIYIYSKEPGTTDPGTTEKENVKVDLEQTWWQG